MSKTANPKENWMLYDPETEKTAFFDNEGEAKGQHQLLSSEDNQLGIYPPGELPEDYESESVATTDESDTEENKAPQEPPQARETNAEVVTEPVNPESLSKDPIGFLRSVNDDFVNVIKSKPAISKQGFRFIQREFEISTESEVVQWIDDPLGCVVWAKAELPNGYSAEAHGEGYQFESDVRDNEFVRYADSRAKNRAISDLTAAGALAVEELQGSRE